MEIQTPETYTIRCCIEKKTRTNPDYKYKEWLEGTFWLFKDDCKIKKLDIVRPLSDVFLNTSLGHKMLSQLANQQYINVLEHVRKTEPYPQNQINQEQLLILNIV